MKKNDSINRQGTVQQQKRKPLPKIPQQNRSSMAFEGTQVFSVGHSWTASNIPIGQFITTNSSNNEMPTITESPTAITNQQTANHYIPQSINGKSSQDHRYSSGSQIMYNQQGSGSADYYNTVDPNYYAAYQQQSSNNGYSSIYSQAYNNGYYSNQQQYYNNYVNNDMTNDISTVSISTTIPTTTTALAPNTITQSKSTEAWKTSSSASDITAATKNILSTTMVKRTDNLKIETNPIPVPFSNGGQLPIETHLEKPFEPTVNTKGDQQQQFTPIQPPQVQQQQQIYRKASKQEISATLVDEGNSILLQKLDVQQQQQRHHALSYDTISSRCSSASGESLSTPQSSVSVSSSFSSSSASYHGLCRQKQKRHDSMPFLHTTLEQADQEEEQEGQRDQSFSAAEKYFQQSANDISPISTRIPSPWGTATSTRKQCIRQRISTGSITNIMAVQMAQVPDEIMHATVTITSSSDENHKEKNSKQGGGTAVVEDYFTEVTKQGGKLSIASCSLIHIRSNTKLYRRMAIKTKNRDTQMTYAKYLLQISKLYEKNTDSPSASLPSSSSSTTSSPIRGNNSSKKKNKVESPAETRHRLLSEAGYWIERLAKASHPEALFIKGRWHLLGPQAHDCVLHGYEKAHEPKAFKCFLQASKLDWTEAHFELAQLYKKRGQFSKAIQCFEKGVKQKHTPSFYVSLVLWLRRRIKK